MIIDLTSATYPIIVASEPEVLELMLCAVQSEDDVPLCEKQEYEDAFPGLFCRGFSPGRLYRTGVKETVVEPHRVDGRWAIYRYHEGSRDAEFLADTWVQGRGPTTFLVWVETHDENGLRGLKVAYVHNERLERPEAKFRQELLRDGFVFDMDPQVTLDLSHFKAGG